MKTNFQRILPLLVLALIVFLAATPVTAAPNSQEAIPPEWGVLAKDVGTRGAWLGLVILLDLILGVTAALKSKTFEWQKLADFLGDYGPKVIGWIALEALSLLPPDLAALAGLGSALGLGAYTIILISAVGSVLTSVQGMGLFPMRVPGVK